MALLPLFFAASLTGCDTLKIKPQGHRVAHPSVPAPDATQKDVALFLARYKAALDRCNAQFPVKP